MEMPDVILSRVTVPKLVKLQDLRSEKMSVLAIHRKNVHVNTCASVMKEPAPGSTALELPPSCGPYAGTPLIDIPIIPLIGISVMVGSFSGCNGIYQPERSDHFNCYF